MSEVPNGIGAAELAGARWVKAKASDALNECIELAAVGENIAMRNSRDPKGPALIFTKGELSAFLNGAAKGEFNGMTV
ncbi:DUF397 domain-containing protein [Streptomyces sp. NPDC048577]|uniref:DUF397 domain-containing protein n=1 Tax=Streptomyces sp. NPDC048577 TaxID=3157209 RepID=UPI0034401D65